jgi:hypothetical protein
MAFTYNITGSFGGYTANPYKYNYNTAIDDLIILSLYTSSLRTGGSISLSGDTTNYIMTQAYPTLNISTYYMEVWYYMNVPGATNYINIPNSGNIQLNGLSTKFTSSNTQMFSSVTGMTGSSTSASLSLPVGSNSNTLFFNPLVSQNAATSWNKNKVPVEQILPPYMYDQYSTGETIGTTTFTWNFSSGNWIGVLIGFEEYSNSTFKIVYDQTNSNRVEFEPNSPYKVFMI